MTSASKRTPPPRPESVEVVVVVNHNDLRRGERGEVELNATVRALLDKGYLRLADEEPYNPEGPTPAGLGSTATHSNSLYRILAVPPRADALGAETSGGGSLLGVMSGG